MFEPESLIKESKYQEISQYTKEKLQEWENMRQQGDRQTLILLENQVSYNDFLMSFFKDGLVQNTEANALFDLGRLYEAGRAYQKELCRLGIIDRSLEWWKKMIEQKPKDITAKPLYQIMLVLYTDAYKTKQELLTELNLNENEIKKYIDLLVKGDFIYVYESGDIVRYTLSDTGNCIARQIKKYSVFCEL